jgi:tRNA 2-(methylsulfanyl)-N6-isopentenyladenosine37 hydroxylase
MLCLKVPTDPTWTAIALSDVDAILVDHAQCELKAASNALSLAARHPGDTELVFALTDLAREEIDHFQRVVAALKARGVVGEVPTEDRYAAELRRAVSALPHAPDLSPLVDRLLVCALIEARSCERFKLLAEGAATRADSLAALWDDLFVAEAQHYRTFVDLAVRAAGGDRAVTIARLERLAHLEGEIVRALGSHERATRAAIHG